MNYPNNFIKATEEYTTFEKYIPAPYFRKAFSVKENTQAKVLITACGFYELYLNGERITKGALAPYISNPDDMVYYDEYEVVLNKGKNVIGILLGNGLCNNPGGYIWDFDKAPFRSAPKFALSVCYTDENGKDVIIESSTDFKTAPSPVIFDDYRFGEHYDANLEISGWNTVCFDDSDWKNAISASEPKGEKRICKADPIVVTDEMKPVAITEINGKFVYDFGLNRAGVCRLKVNGKKGQRIEFQHVEELIDGDIEVGSIWFVRDFWERDKEIVHKDVYICHGEGTETYTPKFTYHGFRYVAVSGITKEQATKDLLTYVVMNSDIKQCGGFKTSNKTVNLLQEMTVRSDLSNFHYFPTDCPHREKNGWTADASFSAEQMLINFTVQKNYTEWMRNIRKAQAKNGAIPGIIPTSGWGFDWGNGPGWDSVIANIPYFSYIYRGETAMIKDTAESFIKYLKYLSSRRDNRGLLAIGLGDWMPVDRECEDFKAPLVVTDSLMALDIANKFAVMLDAVGMDEQSAFAKKFADDIRIAFRKNLIDFDNMTVLGDCQTSQAMAIFYGAFDTEESSKAFARLLDFIREQNNRLDVGVLGCLVIFNVLSQFGYTDLALQMMIAPGFPSYANWIERGATTLWESFSRTDKGYSKNHHFLGHVSAWFVKNIAGINYNPHTNNLKEVDICPNFVAPLNDAEAYFDSNFGTVKSSWKRDNADVILNIDVPECFKGNIILPDGYKFKNGLSLCELKSGTYNIIKD